MNPAPTRILMLCDWLPPDFGAVGQYALAAARALAAEGHEVELVGFSSSGSRIEASMAGQGSLVVRRLHRPAYDRADWIARAWWTFAANLSLLWGARAALARCDEVRFTGSPPYLVHFVVPLARLLGRRTRYRITDFHPECLFAALGRRPWWGGPLQALTRHWRRRVDTIEVLGDDQAERLGESGVDAARMRLVRDPSPVPFDGAVVPATPPPGLDGRRIVLYSGNWGVAHDDATFLAAFVSIARRDAAAAPGLWLNATGARADRVEAECRRLGLPMVRTRPVPLDGLAAVLCAADVHLITLSDAFVGYVLPSKVYACIESGRPVLFIGSRRSDVHRLCASRLAADRYRQVEVGDDAGAARALGELLAAGGVPA